MRPLFLLSLLLPYLLSAQVTIRGSVVDAANGEGLAFVPIAHQGRTLGVTDIEGRFNLSVPALPVELRLSYVGYTPLVITMDDAGPHRVKLVSANTELQAVEVRYAGNPAHRIIKRAIDGRKENDGMRYRSYRYRSYSKTVFTGERDTLRVNAEPDTTVVEPIAADTLAADTAAVDSSLARAHEFLDSQHLLMIESATRKSFIPPAAEREEVLAMRVSGLKDPSLLALAAQTKTFSIYDPQIPISDKNYLGPLAPASTNKYFFLIEDTLYQGKDSVYVISYRPKRGSKFDGLKGLLYINTDGYAVQNVTAEPAERKGVSVRFQQLHERVDGKAWFPVQLNTFIYMDQVQVGPFKMMGIGRTYLRDIEVDAAVLRKEVRGPELVSDRMEVKRDDAYWAELRGGELDAKELKTYAVIDSIGDSLKFDAKLKWFDALTNGRLPIGPMDLLLDRIVSYNDYEGIRLGAGLATNSKISRYWTLGGYGAYGFQDKGWKYGGDLTIKPWYGRDLHLKLSYANDVVETGGVAFRGYRTWMDPEQARMLFVDRMDRTERFQAEIGGRVGNALKVWASTTREDRRNERGYLHWDAARVTAASGALAGSVDLGFRWAFRERIARLPGREISLGTRWPVVNVEANRYVKGLWDGTMDGWRIAARVDKTFRMSLLGDLKLAVFAGAAQNDMPMTYLFNMRGTRSNGLNVVSMGVFETMRPSSFQADRFVAAHMHHDFGTLLVKGKYFHPRLGVTFSAGVAALDKPADHDGMHFAAMKDPYMEAGLRLDKLVAALGVAAFIPVGPYATGDPGKDVVVKLTYALPF